MLIDEVAKLWTHDIFCIINGCMDGDRYDGYLERCEILGFKPLKINDALKHKFEFTRWYELLKKNMSNNITDDEYEEYFHMCICIKHMPMPKGLNCICREDQSLINCGIMYGHIEESARDIYIKNYPCDFWRCGSFTKHQKD